MSGNFEISSDASSDGSRSTCGSDEVIGTTVRPSFPTKDLELEIEPITDDEEDVWMHGEGRETEESSTNLAEKATGNPIGFSPLNADGDVTREEENNDNDDLEDVDMEAQLKKDGAGSTSGSSTASTTHFSKKQCENAKRKRLRIYLALLALLFLIAGSALAVLFTQLSDNGKGEESASNEGFLAGTTPPHSSLVLNEPSSTPSLEPTASLLATPTISPIQSPVSAPATPSTSPAGSIVATTAPVPDPIVVSTRAPTAANPMTSSPLSALPVAAPGAAPVPTDSVIVGFTLIDADSEQEIMQVYEGDVIDLDVLGTSSLNLVANVDPAKAGAVEEVMFSYNSGDSRSEKKAPYALGGNSGGDYFASDWLSTPGIKIVTVSTALEGSGTNEVTTIQFSVIDGDGDGDGMANVPPTRDPVAPRTPAPVVPVSPTPQIAADPSDVRVYGELKQYHKITLAFQNGPEMSETSTPNPFTDYRLDVVFTNGDFSMTVPGYFAADGNAAETSADSGSVWHCHLAPPKTGTWTYQAFFYTGSKVIADWPESVTGAPTPPFHGLTGSFSVGATDKTGRDLRGKGQLQYVGKHHLRFAETGEWFLKAGADSPENFLAYEDFDNTSPRKSWSPHMQDFQDGDPVWQGQKGRGIIGAINYLADQGMNVFSFLTMNINGDDKNVFPYISNQDRLRIDVSKTAQWEVVFEHATKKGFYLHFKTQETENDSLLDDGAFFDVERKMYYRELIARFGHHLALNWNLGEENNNSSEQLKAFSNWFKALDPYQHIVVVHTSIGGQSKVYEPLYGHPTFDGASIQTRYWNVFDDTLTRVQGSAATGRPWIVANDEQGPATDGVVPDDVDPEHDIIRTNVLWGNIMAGGAGVEYYFGYSNPNHDTNCEDFRPRANMWVQSKHALDFFAKFSVPFQNMSNDNSRVTNENWCLVDATESIVVVYLRNGGTADINLSGLAGGVSAGSLAVGWYNPRRGGNLDSGSVASLELVDHPQSLGSAPYDRDRDWVVLLRPS